MSVYQDLERVVVESGLWNDDRRKTHGFLLSPEAYPIFSGELVVLNNLGRAIYQCLEGIAKIAVIASNQELGGNRSWRMVKGVLHSAIPNYYQEISSLKPSRVPLICKVDLMVSNEPPYFFIAEIDGHNKHAMGYATLASQMAQMVKRPEEISFGGVAAFLSKILTNEEEKRSLFFLLSQQERFYLPEVRILQRALAKSGVGSFIAHETEGIFHDVIRGQTLPSWAKTGMDFPFMYHNPCLVRDLVAQYQKNSINFLIPPKPFFGSKGLLALIKNDNEDEDLEAILRSQIPARALALVREHLPETYLVGKGFRQDKWRESVKKYPFLIKKTVASGMKGIWFSDDFQFQHALEQAAIYPGHFILQREIKNKPERLQYFTEEGELTDDDWFLRLTTLFTVLKPETIADIIVTARKDKKVHGALDCLQIGAVKDLSR